MRRISLAALWLASWLGSGVALGQSMVSSTLLKDQGMKEPTLCLFWTPPGGREEPVSAAAYTHRPGADTAALHVKRETTQLQGDKR